MTTELTKAAQQALDRLDALAEPTNGLLAVPENSATVSAIQADLSLIRAALTQRPAAQEVCAHVLYTTQDTDRPDAICDRNGEVVLSMCKLCGKAEAELPAPQQATPEPDDDDKWRDVALRFDKHRMQALWHLNAMLKDPVKHADIVCQFLKDPTHPAAATPEPVGEPVAALVRTRSLRTRAEIAADGKDHFSEWGPWEPQTLSYAKAATAPDRNAHPKLYEMVPLFTRPAPGVPDGFALVPVEPTAEMMEAMPSLPAIGAPGDMELKAKGWPLKAIQNRHRWLAALAAAQAKGAGHG